MLPRWPNSHILKKISFIKSTSTSTSSSHLASFHSTPPSSEKWKYKLNSNYSRYATRQQRTGAKKAMKDNLFKYGSSFSFQDEDEQWKTDEISWDASEAHQKKMKRKFRRESFIEDETRETTFRETFGNISYTWSFKSSNKSSFQSSTTGFKRRDHSVWINSTNKAWGCTSETKFEDESNWQRKTRHSGKRLGGVVRSSSDRTILGLPPRGPLKIEEVKNAYHLLALKWHPDRHQGPSQAMAEENFKVCVNAYESLCHTLSQQLKI